MHVTVLVVAAHPDDEVLGCGGAIARHAAAGEEVAVAFLADGVTSRDINGQHSAEIARRRGAAQRAAQILGVREVTFGELPDNRLDSVALLTLIQLVEGVVDRVRPTTIYTHFAHDLNVDHRLTSEAVITAARPIPGSQVTTVLAFETASSTEWRAASAATTFAPDWFIDISDTLALKLEALEAYAEEMRPWPHPRSTEAVRHLAQWRGSSVGRDAAEAFAVARHIQ
ncbi:MAG: PIG-L deacetylase family protein [Actinomycetota bacterium]|nr:PIG-L deacetylase family protein [Actinomycetota bacterium]